MASLDSTNVLTDIGLHEGRIFCGEQPKSRRPEYGKAVQVAVGWLATARPQATEDKAFQLLGLIWGQAKPEVIRKAARALLGEQRSDGGWAQVPALASDAYATGEALVALKQSGTLSVSDSVCKRLCL